MVFYSCPNHHSLLVGKNFINQWLTGQFRGFIIRVTVMYDQYLGEFILIGLLSWSLGYLIEERTVFYRVLACVWGVLKRSIKQLEQRYLHQHHIS